MYRKRLSLIPPVIIFLIIFGSCTQAKQIVERFSQRQDEKTEENIITSLVPESAAVEKSLSGSSLVLENGNYWTVGIPGFGENALSAFIGEYRIPDITDTIKVWLTREFIYYEGWHNRASITSIQVREKTGFEGRIVASTLNENWTAVMLFPLGSGLSVQDEDRIITYLIGKFGSFSGMNQNISFPAIVAY